MPDPEFVGPTRFVERSSAHYEGFLRAAEEYTFRIPQAMRTGLLLKPLDAANHHVHFLRAIYGVLNVVDKLQLAGGSTIVDAGAGPGWLAEQLLLLGYRVILLEPSQDMLDIARVRITRASVKWEIDLLARATFQRSTIEDLPPYLDASGIADAVLFHEAWHHVVEEDRAARNVFNLLASGGQMAVLTEGRWVPGDRALEVGLETEMQAYGTLESPFTRDYMHFVLDRAGFTEIAFYHAVNGLFRADQGRLTIEDAAGDGHEKGWNNCIARRPREASSLALNVETSHARLLSHSVQRLSDKTVRICVRAENCGLTVWRAAARRAEGLVTLGILDVQTAPNGEREMNGRGTLAADVVAGDTGVFTGDFELPPGSGPYVASLVAEGSFWFTERVQIPLED